MEVEQLNEILGSDAKTDITFLSELNKQEETEPLQNNVSEGKYHCKYSDGFSSDSLTDLMNHYRSTHPEHKGTNRLKKEKALLEETEDKINSPTISNINSEAHNMLDEDNQETSLEPTGPVEVESAKKSRKKAVESDIAQIPSDYDRLSSLLQSFGVPNWKGVIEGMKLYDIRDINILKDLLRNVSTPQGKSDAVVKMWSEIQGINKVSNIDNTTSSVKQTTPTDALSLMAKLRDEQIQDGIVSSYMERLKGQKLENEIAMKRLNGDLMENKNTPDISKIIELEMLKYQMMNQKPNPELEILKLQMMQPKTNPDMDMIKSELSKLQLQLATPKTDGQVELLKQQIESQNKKYEDIQRQISEDAKLKLLSDQHKQEMDILKQQIAEQSKQTQELIKSMQLAGAPKSEDILRTQLSEMQRQNDLKLQEMQKQFNQVFELKRDEESRRTIESLKEEIKSVKENSSGQIGQVAESMKDFATNITHAFEKKELTDQHTKETDDLKKKISDVEHNKSLTNEQYVMEKTTKLAEEGFKAIGGALDGFGKALQPATQRAAESTNTYERAKLALDLKQQGFNEQTIASVLNQPSARASVPSARTEFDNLAKITQQLEQRKEMPLNSQPMEIQSEPQVEQIKFATSPEEK